MKLTSLGYMNRSVKFLLFASLVEHCVNNTQHPTLYALDFVASMAYLLFTPNVRCMSPSSTSDATLHCYVLLDPNRFPRTTLRCASHIHSMN
jgi:hypothetical protein